MTPDQIGEMAAGLAGIWVMQITLWILGLGVKERIQDGVGFSVFYILGYMTGVGI